MATRSNHWAFCAAALTLAAPVAADAPCTRSIIETFGAGAAGVRYGAAVFVDVGGYPRAKLVSDFVPGSWGSWVSPQIDEEVVEFRASFRFSLKNLNGGPGDGFSFGWGDMSNTQGTRASGGEWGVEAFVADNAGLSVGFVTYPSAAGNGIAIKWGATPLAFVPFDFSAERYDDYVQAGNPASMAVATVRWRRDTGTTVTIAPPGQNAITVLADAGQSATAGIDPRSWSFVFAARNGAIDQDVLVGDLAIDLTIACPRHSPDIDGDCAVGGADLGALLARWGSCGGIPCLADLNGDGEVEGSDLALLLSAWGTDPCTNPPP
ncbi:MAG: hypothetical protein FJ260_05660 [Planctomycetes bacterium]|nr:hypothetical protein [Planctomycetota bacterium]